MGLIHTPHGWAYPDPGPCPCGAASAVCGWAFCMCAGAIGGGHPSWRCQACDDVRTLGCVGQGSLDPIRTPPGSEIQQ